MTLKWDVLCKCVYEEPSEMTSEKTVFSLIISGFIKCLFFRLFLALWWKM